MGLREVSKQPLCKLFGVIFFFHKIVSRGLKSQRAEAALHARGDRGAKPQELSAAAFGISPAKPGLWQGNLMTDAGLVATAVLGHANLMASSSHPLSDSAQPG